MLLVDENIALFVLYFGILFQSYNLKTYYKYVSLIFSNILIFFLKKLLKMKENPAGDKRYIHIFILPVNVK